MEKFCFDGKPIVYRETYKEYKNNNSNNNN